MVGINGTKKHNAAEAINGFERGATPSCSSRYKVVPICIFFFVIIISFRFGNGFRKNATNWSLEEPS